MSVSKEQMERVKGYMELTKNLVRKKLGEDFNLTIFDTVINIRHKNGYPLTGRIDIREEGGWYGYRGFSGGSGKLYLVVDAPGYHGKIFKETKKDFEKQFERAVDFVAERMERRKDQEEHIHKVFDIKEKAIKDLIGILGIKDYLDPVHGKIKHTIYVENRTEPKAMVSFTVTLDEIEVENAGEISDKILDFLKEVGQL